MLLQFLLGIAAAMYVGCWLLYLHDPSSYQTGTALFLTGVPMVLSALFIAGSQIDDSDAGSFFFHVGMATIVTFGFVALLGGSYLLFMIYSSGSVLYFFWVCFIVAFFGATMGAAHWLVSKILHFVLKPQRPASWRRQNE